MADEKSGYIYLLSNGLGHYKIGKAKILDKRIRQLKIQLPFKVELIVWGAVKDRHAAEAVLHASYKYARLNGEWFAFDEEDLQWVMRDFGELECGRTVIDESKTEEEECFWRQQAKEYWLGIFDDLEFEKEFITDYIAALWQRERGDYCVA